MTNTIIWTVAILTCLGLVLSLVLFWVARKFKVEEDPRIDEIEKTFGVVVGKQINLIEGGGGGGGATGGDDDHHIMSDEEYYKRYGHRRGEPANFFRGRQ